LGKNYLTTIFSQTNVLHYVFEPEPVELNYKIWGTPNLVITSHVSSGDGES
jgi:phosphoglycerate dehydrogenase-like enzyme